MSTVKLTDITDIKIGQQACTSNNTDSIAIGGGSCTKSQQGAIVIGSNATLKNSSQNTIVIGKGSGAHECGEGSDFCIVIGADALTRSQDSILIGTCVTTAERAISSIAIGSSARVSQDSSMGGTASIAIGAASQSKNGSLSIGGNACSEGCSISIGTGTISSGGGISIGHNVFACSSTGVAIGFLARLNGGGIVIGANSCSFSGIAIGTNVIAGDNIVIGENSCTADGVSNSIAIGSNLKANCSNRIYIGNTTQDELVIGGRSFARLCTGLNKWVLV